MTDPIIELKRLNDEQLNDAMFLAGECALLRESIRALEAENLRLQAQVAELRGALANLIFTATKLWDDAKPIKDTKSMTATHPIIEQAKSAIASDGSKLLEVAKAAEEVAAQYNSAFIGAYKDGWIQELLDRAKELAGVLASWRGEE